MQRNLERLRNGGSFGEFARITRTHWRRMAISLMRRYKCPCDVEVNDLIQEMLMSVYEHLPKYDPNRDVTLVQYISWNANNRAKKYLHRARGALRRDDRAKSRHPIAVSQLAVDPESEGSPIDNWLVVDGNQEVDSEKARHVAMIDRIFADNVRVRETVRIIVKVDGDITAAANDLLAHRVELGLRVASYAEAFALARKVVDALIAA